MCVSQGNGHYFPLKSQSSESQNPLLANEDLWEESDDGSEEGSLGESNVEKYILMFIEGSYISTLNRKPLPIFGS